VHQHGGEEKVGARGVWVLVVLGCEGFSGVVIAGCVQITEAEYVICICICVGHPGTHLLEVWDRCGRLTQPIQGESLHLDRFEVGGIFFHGSFESLLRAKQLSRAVVGNAEFMMQSFDRRLNRHELLEDHERIGDLVAFEILLRLGKLVSRRGWRGHLRGKGEGRDCEKQKHTKTAHNGVRILCAASMWKC
jgi:hypothetical protein